MRDHGGNIDAAVAKFGGKRADWIDLSTGINPRPFPRPKLSAKAWNALPTRAEIARLQEAAAVAYGTKANILPLAGASAGIQLVPLLRSPGKARVLGPTYNEHAAALVQAGWQVETVSEVSDLAGADLATVVNPNNPDGRRFTPEQLSELADQVGLLVVDESFADGWPEVSIAGRVGPETEGLIVLRSFGKFYGLAGLRLGFALGGREVERMSELAGPWPVSGVAIEIGVAAFRDQVWKAESFQRLKSDAARLDALATGAGWSILGGTELFRLYETGDAVAAQEHLARHHIWSRIFPYDKGWVRLGLPDGASNWARVEAAFAAI